MSKIEVNAIEPQSGTTLTVGASGDTVTVPSGVTLDTSNSTLTLPDNSVTTNKIADSNITLAKLSATGTKDATTFLRGDNTFAEAGGGSLTFLGSTTVTTTDVSAISFDGLFTSAYTHYKFIYSIRGATNNTDTIVRIRQSNSDVTASNYWYAGMGMYRASGSTTANTAGANGAGYIRISSADNTDNVAYPTTGELILFNPLSTDVNKTITTTNLGYNSSSTPDAIRIWTFGGQLVDTTAASGLSFLYDGGNIMGTVSLYGIKNS
jgi:hypothetical protein